MSTTSTLSALPKRAAAATFRSASSSIARLFRSPVSPSVVAIFSSCAIIRAFESDVARWLARTSSVGTHRLPERLPALGAEDQRAERAVVEDQRQDEERGDLRPGEAAGEDDLVGGVELAAVRERAAVLNDHRDEPGVRRETRADEVVDLPVGPLGGDDLVHPGGLVEDRDRGEVEARDLARALHGGVEDVLLAERRAERLRRAVQLPLLHLRPFQLDEDPLVLDRAQTVPRGLRGELLFVRREGAVVDAVDRENPAKGAAPFSGAARAARRTEALSPALCPAASSTGMAVSARTGHGPS